MRLKQKEHFSGTPRGRRGTSGSPQVGTAGFGPVKVSQLNERAPYGQATSQ